VLPVELSIPEELREELTMDVSPPEIPLIPGDFAWMVPYEAVKSEKVRLGIMMRAAEKTVVVEKVLPGTPAEEVGIRAGDVLVSLDGLAVEEQGDVILVIGGKKPGDTVKVVLRRDGAEITVQPVLRLPPEPPAGHPAKP
jgi:S1-C subfamily serine protease